MAETIVPRDASTILLLRDGEPGLEVLMLRRNLASTWVGGAHLFPGGAVDSEDGSEEMRARSPRLTDEQASERLKIRRGGLAFFVAAIRECFEEAGILLARRSDGAPVELGDPQVSERLVAHRHALNAGKTSFAAVCDREDLVLDTDRLGYFSHWITPEGSPRRYDTRFFVAATPPGQKALHDDIEVIDAIWIAPREALRRRKAGEIDMLFPTAKNLEEVAGYDGAAALVEATRTLEVPTILPKLTIDGDEEIHLLLPTDEGYEEATGVGEQIAFPDRSRTP